MSANMKIVKRATIAQINSVRGGFKNITEKTHAGDFVGIARGYSTKTSDNMATSYAFEGEFIALNRHNEEFRAPVCYLPEPAQSMLKTGLDSGAGSIEFAFRFFLIPDTTTPMGYHFEMESLLAPKDSDALERLKAKAVKMLDAPHAHDETIPAPEPKHETKRPKLL